MSEDRDVQLPLVFALMGGANGNGRLTPVALPADLRLPENWIERVARSLAGEHLCAPPSSMAVKLPSEQAASDGSTYSCPECGQVYALAGDDAAAVVDQPMPSNVIPFPGPRRR
jgi:hypothetical protein